MLVIAGPCVIESQQLCEEIAGHMSEVCRKLNLHYVFKASFDKANRTSIDGYRGPGIEKGLCTLEHIRETFDIPVTTDVHEVGQVHEVASVVDMLQIPAFLCRQTDLLLEAAKYDLPINVKRMPSLPPHKTKHIVEKIKSVSNKKVYLCERGTSYGSDLIMDIRAIRTMSDFAPVIFDATHSAQIPGSLSNTTEGNRDLAMHYAKAVAGTGLASGFFFETHPDPDRALSDGPNSIQLCNMESLLENIISIQGY